MEERLGGTRTTFSLTVHCNTDLQVLSSDCFKGSVLQDVTDLFHFLSVQLEILLICLDNAQTAFSITV